MSLSLFAAAQEAPAGRRGAGPKRRGGQSPTQACLPDCRSGFTCVKGLCVSKCNPLCGEDERCTDAGECAPITENGPEDNAEQSEQAPPEAKAPFERRDRGEPAAVDKAGGLTEERPHVRRHDGFYFRMGLGPSAFYGSDGTGLAGELTDLGGTLEFAIGGTAGRGVVVGAASLPTVFMNDGAIGLPEARFFTFLGPFVDYYPNPSKGFHIETAVGLVTYYGDRVPAVGLPGLMLGGGYEWWAGEQWSVGLLGRLNTYVPSSNAANGEDGGVAFSTLVTFTYH